VGVLVDEPSRPDANTGEGQKFVDIYRSLDDADKAMVRKWAEELDTSEIHRRVIRANFDIGQTTVRRGIARMKAASWEC